DASFDAVACGHGLQFTPDLPRALREARRVLRVSGRLAASVPVGGDSSRPWTVMDKVVDRWLPPAPKASDQGPTRSTVNNAGALRVDAFHPGIKSAAQIEKLVTDAKRANVNTLIVQVRKRGDAYFNKSIEPRASDIQGPIDFDPLDYLLRLAHSSTPRIEVHAWVNVYFTGESSLVYSLHGSVWGNKANDGVGSGFLDPGVPEVAIYTHRVFMDLVRNYDIDGLHLDYVRYPGVTWGYNNSAIELYKLQTGVTRTPGPADPTWQAWRGARVTNFVREL